ncbi:MAG: PQQ-binding-like beta-propeller repeat protein, partial [Planctomycetota bacterium]
MIFLLGVAVFGLLLLRGEAALDGDATQLVFAALGVMAGTLAALLVWWIGFSRLRVRTKAVGLAIFAVCGAAAAGSVRIEQVDGAMRPTKWSFRWQKSAEEKALDALAAVEQAESAEWTPPVAAAATDWPRFRGPGGDGVVPAGSVRLDWDARPPEALWRQPVGLGWSSFTVVGGRAFTQEQRGDDELVVCYEAETGAQVWAHATADRFSEPVGGDGPRATPTFADGVLYAVGATGRLSALDPADGKPLWERDILADAGDGKPLENNPWAVAASPLVSGGRVYLPAGNEVAGRVLCYDATTGEPVWQGGEDPASYATFVTETFGDVEQLLVFDGAGLNGFDAADGRSLWHVDFTNQPKVNAIVPVVRDGRVFVSSGYGVGSALFDVTY